MFQVVVGALLRREEVHHHVGEVQQDPARVRGALPPQGADAVVAEVAVQRVDERVQVAGVGGTRDNEVVRKGRDVADVEQENVFRLPVGEEVDDASGEVGRLQVLPLRNEGGWWGEYSMPVDPSRTVE